MRKSTLFVLLIALSAAAIFAWSCGTGDDSTDGSSGASGPPASPTWENFVQGYFQDYCQTCHSSQFAGSTRNGAPADLNFDTYDEVVAASSLVQDEISTGGMPPPQATQPPTTWSDKVLEWIDNGMPAN